LNYTYTSFTTITFAVPREGISSIEIAATATKHPTDFHGLRFLPEDHHLYGGAISPCREGYYNTAEV
jgi:hypothetical protein